MSYVTTKSWYASRTFWFNVSIAIVAALWTTISPYLPLTAEQATTLAAMGNIVLRWFTTQPIATPTPLVDLGVR